ncbi:MAG: hypothetical protein LW875_07495 [Proteobacteria bacterium]|jgi:hypothetical protein|nr:hypothetical protein [Pseudomonadota bacterium]
MGFFVFVTLFVSVHAWAQGQLHFPIDRMPLRTLPQRFDYRLIDKDRFQIGNLTMDFSSFQFEIENTDSRPQLTITWPSALLKRGFVVVRDNSGKTIWKTGLDSDRLSSNERTSNLVIEKYPEDLLSQLRQYPFFRVCILNEEGLTRVLACSKDMFLRNEAGRWTVVSRDSRRKESFIEINGRRVDPVGSVFLAKNDETLNLRSLLMSGAHLEIFTRKKEMNFFDVALDETKEVLLLKSTDTSPNDDGPTPTLSDGPWQFELRLERPSLYFYSEGGIPLLQEFVINGKIRPVSLQMITVGTPAQSSPSREYSLLIQKPLGYTISPADPLSKVRVLPSGNVEWTLLQLDGETVQRRYIKISDGQNDYFAAWDVSRALPWSLSMTGYLPFWIKLSGSYHHHQLWSSLFEFENSFETGGDAVDYTAVKIGALRSFKSFQYGLMINSLQFDQGLIDGDTITLSPLLGWLKNFPTVFSDQIFFDGRYSLLSSGDLKIKKHSDFSFGISKNWKKSWDLRTGVRYFGVQAEKDSRVSGFHRNQFFMGLDHQF